MKSIKIGCPHCGEEFPVVFVGNFEKVRLREVDKEESDEEMRIISFDQRNPVKIYPNQVDETKEYLKVIVDDNKTTRRFYVFRVLPGGKVTVYTVKGETKNYRMRAKNFYVDGGDGSVYMPAWGVSDITDSQRHKFDEDESKDLAKRTSFELNYIENENTYILKINDKVEPLMRKGKVNEELILKLIKAWKGCWEV